MREIKFKLAYFTDERQDTEKEGWIVSKAVDLESLITGDGQFDFSDGGYLGFDDVSWGEDKYEWLRFTGLKDKNGKEIYEGDIVKDLYEKVTVVEYQAPAFVLRNHFRLDNDNNELIEILGNIYENPELANPEKE